MVRLKSFLAIYVSVLAIAAAFSILVVPALQNHVVSMTPKVTEHHFSVRWMGFAPADYNNSYPDYYVCINNLKGNQLNMSIALQIKNQEANPFYFLIDQYVSPPPNWTISQYQIGLIAVDGTKSFNYTNISRAKPGSITSGILNESVNLVVKAYDDSGYTSLYSQDNFTVSYHFIDRTSGWSQLYYDNFEDGTTEGWNPAGSWSSAALSTDYYRSFQHSYQLKETGGWYYSVGYAKTFNTTGHDNCVLLFSLRSPRWDDLQIAVNGTTYFKPDASLASNTWYQFAAPIPAGITQVNIWVAGDLDSAYLDDVYVIAR